VYDKEDKAYNDAFSGGTPSLTQINPSWRYATQIQSRYRQNYFAINKVNNKSNVSLNSMSITVAPIGVKLGVGHLDIRPASLVVNNSKAYLSRGASIDFLGFGLKVDQISHNLGKNWSEINVEYNPGWNIKDGLNYNGSFGIRGFGFDAAYDFSIPVIEPVY
jgi:hypothetical protein